MPFVNSREHSAKRPTANALRNLPQTHADLLRQEFGEFTAETQSSLRTEIFAQLRDEDWAKPKGFN